MKKNLILLIAVMSTVVARSQAVKAQDAIPKDSIVKMAKDRKTKLTIGNDDFMINLTMDNLIAGGKGDSLYNSNWFNPSLGFYFMYNVPLGKTSGMSIAPGLGFTFSKTNLDKSKLYYDSTGVYFDNTKNNDFFTTNSYQSSSFYTSWIEAPIELRYKTKPINGRSSIKFAVGFRAGLRLASNSKVSYTNSQTGDELTVKESPMKAINFFRYGITGRVGFGAVNLFCYIGQSQLFKDLPNTRNQDLRQYSVGFSITGM